MDPDNFSLVIELDDSDSWSDSSEDSQQELTRVTAAQLEAELESLRSALRSAHTELESLRLQETFFSPAFPPSLNYTEETNERDLKGSIRALEYRIHRLTAEISNLNRRYISARRAEDEGQLPARVLNKEERTVFVLGMGSEYCSSSEVKKVFTAASSSEVENIQLFKRHSLVTFSSKQGALKALELNNSFPLGGGGRRIKVRPKLEPWRDVKKMPLTISWEEPKSMDFSFTFTVPRGASLSPERKEGGGMEWREEGGEVMACA